jgi:3-deoxy-manno-octulosonate cytidylyltransferase (CMP-KDO synthetase)
MKSKIDIIIPARLNSSRLPRKVVLKLGDKTMLQRVFENFKIIEGAEINKVYIAVDSLELFNIAKQFCPIDQIILTSINHINGTSRISEAILKTNSDFIINIQADEPFVTPQIIKPIIKLIEDGNIEIVSTYSKIKEEPDFHNPNVVKLVIDKHNNAIYFSRSAIPFFRDSKDFKVEKTLKHHGIYAYSRNFFEKYSKIEKGSLSEIESLEQLQFLENGFKIKMVEIDGFFKGIDTYEDYIKANHFFENNN